jgi:hypothetical protein
MFAVAAGSAFFGGIVAMALLFAGLGLVGLVIGLVATLLPLAAFGPRTAHVRGLPFLLAMCFAFVLLLWPLAWLVVALAWSGITGEPIGN